ncbi:restriction endonuclease [Streptomyces profundus]|uniref:restriction endonuclease n=1 Tax=Streptomyces profundus TaxID=2867410 RepID=UPI001D1606A0|nr:restriction endonuclease [Streptomyces sp. MA3_2.13]UED84429.1 restriction endonuclease [Streptomyces sp. MA3_2.13]
MNNRRSGRRSRRAPRRGPVVGGVLLLVFGLARWGWAAVLVVGLVAGVAVSLWWARRVHRRARAGDREWRRQDAVLANNRSLADVDALSGEGFEELVAARLRADGCTEVERVGGGGDQGRDIAGKLPDGRGMVVQCKRYAPHRAVTAPAMQRLLGTRTHFAADIALCVTNTRYTAQAAEFARANGIVLVHRDLLGPWLGGARLDTLIELNGAGLGDRRHLSTWRRAYGTGPRPRPRRKRPPRPPRPRSPAP